LNLSTLAKFESMSFVFANTSGTKLVLNLLDTTYYDFEIQIDSISCNS